jgi:ABC-type transport system involved in multi-copper enzyme maturation permease subunit
VSDLLRAELLRLWSRRLVRVLAILAVLGIAVGVTIGTINSKPGNELQLFSLPDLLKGTAFILVVIGLVIGASSVGADWQTGGMSTLLTWEPRRVRVLFARTLVVIAVVFALTVALQTLLSLAIAGGASMRGSTVGTGGTWLREVVGVIVRIGGAAVLGAVFGLTLAMIGRNTSAALGASFAYLAIIESLLRGLIPKIGPAMLSSNVVVFVDGRAASPGGDGQLITVTHATVTMAVYACVLLAVALAMFRSRDVT